MLGFSKKTCLVRLRCYISDGSNENWVRKTSSKVAKWNVKYEKVIKSFCVLIAVLSPGDFKCTINGIPSNVVKRKNTRRVWYYCCKSTNNTYTCTPMLYFYGQDMSFPRHLLVVWMTFRRGQSALKTHRHSLSIKHCGKTNMIYVPKCIFLDQHSLLLRIVMWSKTAVYSRK